MQGIAVGRQLKGWSTIYKTNAGGGNVNLRAVGRLYKHRVYKRRMSTSFSVTPAIENDISYVLFSKGEPKTRSMDASFSVSGDVNASINGVPYTEWHAHKLKDMDSSYITSSGVANGEIIFTMERDEDA